MPDLAHARRIMDRVPKPKAIDPGTFTHTEYFDRPTRPHEHCALVKCDNHERCMFPAHCVSARENQDAE